MERAMVAVALGGAAGSVLRYALGLLLAQAGGADRLPTATLLVNILGSLAIGLVSGWLAREPAAGPAVRAFAVTGVLGGFTTYSAFAMETVSLAQTGAPALALLNVAAHVVLGISAAWLGTWLVS
jgi:CrcB protein